MTTEATNNTPAPENTQAAEGGEGNPAAAQHAAKKEQRFLKAKVNGKEELVSEDALLRDYQKYRSGDERLAQASQKERQIESFLQQLETDPEAAFRQTGLSKEKKQALAEKWLAEQIEEEMRDPRESELMEMKARLEKYETKEKQSKEDAEREAQERDRAETIQKRQQHFMETFSKAMELSPLAKDPETAVEALRSMALHYRLAKQAKYEASPEELAGVVEERHLKSMWSAAQKLDGADLIKFLGKDVLKKIRGHDLAQWDKQTKAPAVAQDWQPREEGTRTKKSSLDAIRKMARDDR